MFMRQSASSMLVLLLYVDDIILSGSDPIALSSFAEALSSRFAMKDLGDLNFFWRFDMLGTNSVSSPMPSTPQPSLHHGDLLPDLTVYRSMGIVRHILLLCPISDLSLIAYADADWARCLDSRHSTFGYALLLGSIVVS
ncbi:hypothetical protein RJ639_038481 [Escallonia herrerae]|uniref:Reverse transcriptase Ty1/copia-type domain-containing protein n=1 Tax=Escallonia herrerae TaxID=1293975 RepID=A0AA89BA11_9ASTE|nr:hypothetical protein RJ639_038481 [Escallonia herrerae]